MVEVTDAALQQAAGEGMDAFIQVFTDAYKRVIGGELTADTMPLLTGEQHSRFKQIGVCRQKDI